MLITAWAITVAILPFALWVLVRSWRSPWALPFVLMSGFAIVELWEAQQWYQAAVGWQAAYQRCIGQCPQQLQSPLNPSRTGSISEFVGADSETAWLALYSATPQCGETNYPHLRVLDKNRSWQEAAQIIVMHLHFF